MFEYDLAGKQAVLVLQEETVKSLEPLGIPGSPLYARIHKVEESGLWLDNPSFPLCPIDQPRLYSPEGEAFCHAHVFIPAASVISVAVFPETIKGVGERTEIHQIGFKPKQGARPKA